MNKKLFLTLTVAMTLATLNQKAQVSNYTFTQTLGAYGPANTGTMVGNNMQDDDVTPVSLPFTFKYNGTNYNNVNVCSNGCLSFNSLTGFEYTPLSDNSTSNVISAFGGNLVMGSFITCDLTNGSQTLTNISSVAGFAVGDVLFDYGSDFVGNVNPTITAISPGFIVVNVAANNTQQGYFAAGLNGSIKQSVSGVAPNRVCEFQFANFSTSNNTTDEVINFKIRLYETSNNIQFVYGNCQMLGLFHAPITVEVGLKGAGNNDFNSRKVVAPITWSNSVASTTINDACDFSPPVGPSPTKAPLIGQSYLWAPPSCTVPVIAIAPSSQTICAGQNLTLAATGANSYTWANGAMTPSVVVYPANGSTFSVLGAIGTCTSILTYTANVAPNPTINIAQSKTLICVGQTSTLTASGAGTYSWSSGPNDPKFIVNPTVTTIYTVTGVLGICKATATITQIVNLCTFLNKMELVSSLIKTYPNPFNNFIVVKNESASQSQLIIMDAIGNKVYVSTINGEEETTVDTSNFSNGLYFITLSGPNGDTTRKLIKQ